MIFVKIEIYLLNFANIFHAKIQPTKRMAFENIKRRALLKRRKNASRSIMVVEKVKSVLGNLDRLFRSKRQHQVATAFSGIVFHSRDMVLIRELRKLREEEVIKF